MLHGAPGLCTCEHIPHCAALAPAAGRVGRNARLSSSSGSPAELSSESDALEPDSAPDAKLESSDARAFDLRRPSASSKPYCGQQSAADPPE
jgi:hypothetical protein